MAAEVKFETDLQLDKLLTTNKAMEAKVQRIVKKILGEVVGRMRGRMHGVSSKEAYRAIRKSVYKRVLGGNVNIIPPLYGAGKRAPLPPVHHRLVNETNSKGNHRGGNRIPRSRRTENLLTYWGSDRGFILRFLNEGTPNRSTNGVRNVGQIGGNRWFSRMSQDELERTAQMFDELMTKLINEEFNKK